MTFPATTPSAIPAVTELDGISLQPLRPENAGVVAAVLQMRGHRQILDIPPDEVAIAQLLSSLQQQPFALPLAAVVDGQCMGIATTSLANVKSLHASFNAFFVDPSTATTALAMFVRHLLWSFPLRRLHAQIPDMDLTHEYVDLLQTAGFRTEGRLQDHLVLAGRAFDVVSLGLTRDDFDAWCDAEEPRLSLDT